MRRRRQVGIAHAKVDDVLAPRSRRCPHRVHFGDDIRWQASNTVKFRSEEHTSELQSLMRISYAVFCLKKKKSSIFFIFSLSLLSLFFFTSSYSFLFYTFFLSLSLLLFIF